MQDGEYAMKRCYFVDDSSLIFHGQSVRPMWYSCLIWGWGRFYVCRVLIVDARAICDLVDLVEKNVRETSIERDRTKTCVRASVKVNKRYEYGTGKCRWPGRSFGPRCREYPWREKSIDQSTICRNREVATWTFGGHWRTWRPALRGVKIQVRARDDWSNTSTRWQVFILILSIYFN